MIDLKTEKFLNDGGWKWDFREGMPLSEIDIKRSRDNPARLKGRYDTAFVDKYATAMSNGADFPAIVVFDRPSSLFLSSTGMVVATGMHRIGAAEKAKIVALDAYVVSEPDAYRRELLTRSLNTIEGKAEDQALEQAASMYLRYPEIAITTHAKNFGVQPTTLNTIVGSNEARDRAKQLGIEVDLHWKVPNQVMYLMNAVKNNVIFRALAEFAMNNDHVPAEDYRNLFRDVKMATSEQDGLETIRNAQVDADAIREKNRAKGARTPPGPARKIINLCRQITRTAEVGMDRLFLSSLPNHRAAKTQVEAAIESLKKVQRELATLSSVMIGFDRSNGDRRSTPPDQPDA